MRAHRIRARVSASHEVRVILPSDFAPGEVEVIVPETPRDEALEREHKLTVDELLASRLTPSPGVGAVTLEDWERAVAEAGSGRGGV